MLYRYRLLKTALGLLLILSIAASCGQESSSNSGGQMSYKEVKTMVIDILGSEEAQKAMEKASSKNAGSTLQSSSLSVSDQAQVRIAVKDVLTSPDYSKELEKIMKDPKFAGEFAMAVSKDNKQIHKDLLKDPTYQKDLVSMFKAPEMNKILSDSMKTPEVRKLIMSSVTEAMDNPLFKLEILKLLQSAVKEELSPKEESKKKGKEESNGGGSSPESSPTSSPSSSPQSSPSGKDG